jgi:hypothetical protein
LYSPMECFDMDEECWVHVHAATQILQTNKIRIFLKTTHSLTHTTLTHTTLTHTTQTHITQTHTTLTHTTLTHTTLTPFDSWIPTSHRPISYISTPSPPSVPLPTSGMLFIVPRHRDFVLHALQDRSKTRV